MSELYFERQGKNVTSLVNLYSNWCFLVVSEL